MKPVLSIIIPVLNEQHTINATLSALTGLDGFEQAEIIVVDGDPEGSTLRSITHDPVLKIISSPGRGIQMNAGAGHAQGLFIVFLHADTQLPQSALRLILDLFSRPHISGGAFDLGIDAPGPAFRIIEKSASLRSRLTRTPYGDQALFLRRHRFKSLGGFKTISIMEDVDLMRRLKHQGGQIHIFSSPVNTSARRWHNEGILACTLRNWFLLLLYFAGIKPEKLSQFY